MKLDEVLKEIEVTKKDYEALKARFDKLKSDVEAKQKIIETSTEEIAKQNALIEGAEIRKGTAGADKSVEDAKIAAAKAAKAAAEKAKKDAEREIAKLKSKKENSKLISDLKEKKAKVTELTAMLCQEPSIANALKTEIESQYASKINRNQKALDKKEAERVTVIKGLLGEDKDKDPKGEVKKSLADTVKKFQKLSDRHKITANDPVAYQDAKKALKDLIEKTYGIKLKEEDMQHIIEEAEAGRLTDKTLIPSIEKSKATTQKTIDRQKAERDARVAEIDRMAGMARAPLSPEDQAKATANQTKIAENEAKIAQLKAELAGLSSPEFEKARQDMIDKNVLPVQITEKLRDEETPEGKAFKEFIDATIAVREAFGKRKLDGSAEVSKGLKEAIEKYKGIADKLTGLTGFKVEAFQNEVRDMINVGDLKEMTEEAYHTDNKALKELGTPSEEEHKKLVKATEEYDDLQERVLNGDYDAVTREASKFESYDKALEEAENKGFKVKPQKALNTKPKGFWNRLKSTFSKMSRSFNKWLDRNNHEELPSSKLTPEEIADLQSAYTEHYDPDKDSKIAEKMAEIARLERENADLRATMPRATTTRTLETVGREEAMARRKEVLKRQDESKKVIEEDEPEL